MISLAFETVLFVLTIIKFVDAVKQGWGKGPIMQQFVTDGTWAYLLIFLVMLVNMMLYKYVHSTLTGICYTYVYDPLSPVHRLWELTKVFRWLLVVMSFAVRLPVCVSPRTFLMYTQGSRLVLNPRRSSASQYASSDASDMEMSHLSSFGRCLRARDLGPGIMVTIERITDGMCSSRFVTLCRMSDKHPYRSRLGEGLIVCSPFPTPTHTLLSLSRCASSP